MLYTRKGDDGTSALWGARERLPKDASVFEALGSLDELVSFLGIVKTRPESEELGVGKKKLVEVIENVQQHLFTIQAEIAGAQKTLEAEKILWLEENIAEIEKELPQITTFLLPGGTALSALFDYARTIVRRTERRLAALDRKTTVGGNVKKYINRLSSLLYALARLVNARSGLPETPPRYA